MIELWSADQLKAEITDEIAKDMGLHIRNLMSQGHEAVGLDLGGFTVIEYHYIPAESIRMVLQVKGKSLIMEVFQDQDGVRRTQLFKRKRMVPVIDYVDLKTKQADPGVSTTFG